MFNGKNLIMQEKRKTAPAVYAIFLRHGCTLFCFQWRKTRPSNCPMQPDTVHSSCVCHPKTTRQAAKLVNHDTVVARSRLPFLTERIPPDGSSFDLQCAWTMLFLRESCGVTKSHGFCHLKRMIMCCKWYFRIHLLVAKIYLGHGSQMCVDQILYFWAIVPSRSPIL